MSSIPASIPQYIDNNAEKFIDRLEKAVAIKSISGDASYRKYVIEMGDFIDEELKKLGASTKKVQLGEHEMDGQKLQLPPAVLGTLGSDPNKKTVLLYGHYDVQPASHSNQQCLDTGRAFR